MKQLAIVFTQMPHGRTGGREALDLALLSASYDIPTQCFFVGDGVYQLLTGQEPGQIESRDYIATFKALPMYDIEQIWVCQESLQQRGLVADDLMMPVNVLTRQQLTQQLNGTEQVLTF
ncbi:tRNA 2-thiouridine synthesizing protein C [Ferrimonas sediminum]|uniref:tRNA 2-thiouridine synthesizing protein C n=1 Tax=Ferrimonas sediminum TaxID=718193 RepID=A0A1G9BEU1_9GAMM|nr:sulfurtransferase complex subunit TusC [Ferrimonas sediminum]SDK37680.1 tRNA 2-thiouridine synthesizing protein C [Ferrimonas sediminum]